MSEQVLGPRAQHIELGANRFLDHSLVQLTFARFRLFFREPDAIFWIFVFPILLALGLGIAFRNRPPEVTKIGVVGTNLAATLRAGKDLSISATDRESGELALRTGRIQLLVIASPTGVIYRYDDTNPDARTARLLTDRALQRSSGRPDAIKTKDDLVREPGSRYIDLSCLDC